MDFDYKKPMHILALLLIIGSIFVILVLPVLSFFNFFPSTQSVEYQQLAEDLNLMLQISVLFFQLIFAFVFFMLIPALWYIFVNSCSIRKVFQKLRLTIENIDIAFLYGLLAAIGIYAISFVFVIVLQSTGYEVEDLSNIPDLTRMFSPPILIFLVAIMPVAEEVFFRGFLLEKIESFAGSSVAIIVTSFLFGIAHASYGKIFPIILPILMGILLAYIVIKTRNLYASIIAHVIYNVVAMVLYYLGMSLQ